MNLSIAPPPLAGLDMTDTEDADVAFRTLAYNIERALDLGLRKLAAKTALPVAGGLTLDQIADRLPKRGDIRAVYMTWGEALTRKGWAICDGTNGTPEFHPRPGSSLSPAFARGVAWGSAVSWSAKGRDGGCSTHCHTITATANSHTHAIVADAHSHIIGTDRAVETNAGNAHAHAIVAAATHEHTIACAGSHSHTISSCGSHNHGGETAGAIDCGTCLHTCEAPSGPYCCSPSWASYLDHDHTITTCGAHDHGGTVGSVAASHTHGGKTGADGAHNHGATTGQVDAHSHTIVGQQTDDETATATAAVSAPSVSASSSTATSEPPYVALIFMMKL